MAKAEKIITTNQRTFLATMAVAVPAVAVMALTSPPRDPIFDAIDAHREAIAKFNTEHERPVAAGGPDGSNWHPAQAALMAEVAAAKALIETAPTTRAGLRALERHLHEDDSRLALHFIKRPFTVDGRRMGAVSGGSEGVDWLIAQRAAEIGTV